MEGMPYSYNAIADKHPDVRDLVERIYQQGQHKSERIMELEAAIRAILAINEQKTLVDERGMFGDSQSMELSKVLDTAECLVGWKQ